MNPFDTTTETPTPSTEELQKEDTVSIRKDTLKSGEKAIVISEKKSALTLKKKKKKGKGSVTIDEVILILECDPRTLSPESLSIYGELCSRKAAQENLRQEHKRKEVLNDVQDILQQIVPETNIDENTPIIDQLATLADKINAPNTDVDKRIEEREE